MNTDRGPIFVIGSPRSGTTILTWCLGQHPNILPMEESNWFASLALDLQACYELGTARKERSQLSAMGIGRDQLFKAVGSSISRLLLDERSSYEAKSAEVALSAPTKNPAASTFLLSRKASDPKGRWVDGTPEYSLSVFGLHKLFPNCKFIHLLRDVSSVVKSLMLFSRVAGFSLVKTEQEAFEYWLRTVRACVTAEKAFGSNTIQRVQYRDLLEAPEATIRRSLEFVGESFNPDCVLPLQTKINSSNVPPNYDPTDSRTDMAVREQALSLSRVLSSEAQGTYPGSPELVAELETAFLNQSRFRSWAGKELVRRIEAERKQAIEKEVLKNSLPKKG